MPLDLNAVGQAAMQETDHRLDNQRHLATAAIAQQLAQQQGALAASRQAADRQFTFADQQRQLNEAAARASLAARQAAESSESDAARQQEIEDREAENREWYRRQRFMAGMDATGRHRDRRWAREDQADALALEEELSLPRIADFGNSQVMGSRGQALLREGGRRPSVRMMRSDRGRDWTERVRNEIRPHVQSGDSDAALQAALEFFRGLGHNRRADEMASIALYDLGFLPELQG
jgi:hypothetical protein